jgi:hypothetical protein
MARHESDTHRRMRIYRDLLIETIQWPGDHTFLEWRDRVRGILLETNAIDPAHLKADFQVGRGKGR